MKKGTRDRKKFQLIIIGSISLLIAVGIVTSIFLMQRSDPSALEPVTNPYVGDKDIDSINEREIENPEEYDH